jgi:lipoprotein-anchoring transpeptidase ErfK/SrfK
MQGPEPVPWRIRPWVLFAGAVAAVALIILLVNAISTPPPPANQPASQPASHHGSGHAASAQARASTTTTEGGELAVLDTVPAAGAQNVATNTAITATFSRPVRLGDATPTLSPKIGGKWVQTNATTLTYELRSPLIPSSQVEVTIPGGRSGIRGAQGATLTRSASVSFTVAAGDTLRLQQLLALVDYLPVKFIPSGPPPTPADMAIDQAGSFNWRWATLPAELTSQWTQGTSKEITRAAVEEFENQNDLGVDGIAGPAVWTALINDALNNKVSGTPYVYVLVNKVLPENLTLWSNGAPKYVGIPVNTGLSGADTTDGTYAVFEHVRYSEMKGTNPDGSHYDDPNVPYASYFNGGDALHGFIRGSFGSPQSNGCVEMSYADAALVWPLTPIGTLVTVEGPNYGSAPPAPPPPPPTTALTTTTAPPAPPPPPPTTALTTTTASPAPAGG